MIFEKEKYYKYINQLEKCQSVIYITIIILSVLIGLTKGLKGLIITIPIGLFFEWLYTFKMKVTIQEMKWKFDIYNKIMERGN